MQHCCGYSNLGVPLLEYSASTAVKGAAPHAVKFCRVPLKVLQLAVAIAVSTALRETEYLVRENVDV